ncbi:MAG: efflux RND transporter permease subunit [Methylococcaceae bacterium]|nr:efflux RND transporter permease subunit [Methylococcaceae bacterium]
MSDHQHLERHTNNSTQTSLITRIVKLFTIGSLSPMLIIAALMAGAAALMLTPREEDPQIIVPVMDVMVEFPGASAEEVEKLVTTPLESLLKQIEGVEYVYSAASPGIAMVTVRYYVGENLEDSLIKTWSQVMSNQDSMAPGIARWIVKPVNIDDVPIVLLNLSSNSNNQSEMSLRRTADELIARLRDVENVAKSWVVGGARRQITVHPDAAALVAHGTSIMEIIQAVGSSNINVNAGNFANNNQQVYLEAGPHYSTPEEVGATVIKSADGRLVYLRDVARILDGEEDKNTYTRIGFGPESAKMRLLAIDQEIKGQAGKEWPTVTLAIAKRKGSNAVQVAEDVIAMAKSFQGTIVPNDITMSISRDSGETANNKVNELVEHLMLAILIIVILMIFSLGSRESLIVSIAVPVTFAFTLLCDLIFGYTINRVTLFALILSLGLLVDDPIVNVENIHRHYLLRKEPPLQALLSAIQEVLPPTIVATFAVILTFLPMFFITGMMGPYMAPMAFNVPVAMLVSLIVSLTITPWASYLLLKHHDHDDDQQSFDLKQTGVYKFYHKTLGALIATPGRAWFFVLVIVIAFIGSAMLAVTRAVPLKLLPFDNKNELQLVIDMPKNSTLEQTDQVARALGQYLATVDEVTDYQTYIGQASPMDFNGMVRHYYLRSGSNVGEIRINLIAKEERKQQSHQIALRMRKQIEAIANTYHANVKIVESPPGPPVLDTLVAEVYGPEDASYAELLAVGKNVRERFIRTEGVVDVDDYSYVPYQRLLFNIDREKAALTHVDSQQIAQTLKTALSGQLLGTLHITSERQPLEIILQLPREQRSYIAQLLTLRVKSQTGELVPLAELGEIKELSPEQTFYHKNMRRVAYVIGDTAGRSPVEAIIDLLGDFSDHPLPDGYSAELGGEGEWKITVDVFRDLGLAFAAALLMIYVLLVVQTGSLSLPAIMMIAIPLTVIGIMPGFWLLNVLFATPVDGYPDQIFFTATAMIGMIALAGIVVRNGIILIDFIEKTRHREDRPNITDTLIEAGATRLRPILLTAAAAMFGAVVIILDPVFSGLAWSFIFGIFASTGFSLFVIPVAYYLINRNKPLEEST